MTDATDPRQADPPAVPSSVPEPAAGGESIVRRVWRAFGREPMLLVTCGYLFVSIVGICDSYWFYRRFDVPILEYMHSSDYFVAGLRRPSFALALAGMLLLGGLGLWADRWAMRNPERAEHLRQTTWWAKELLPKRSDWRHYGGMHPETATALAVLVAIVLMLFVATNSRAGNIQGGGGHAVRVTLIGASSPMSGDLRLLGTSSAFVFLWRADERRTEVVPIQGIAHIDALRRPVAASVAPDASDTSTEPAEPAESSEPESAAPRRPASE